MFMPTVVIDRVRLPVIEGTSDLKEREIAYDEKSKKLVFKIGNEVKYIPFEDTIVKDLFEQLKKYIQEHSLPIPVIQKVQDLEKQKNPINGQICYCERTGTVYIYIDDTWWQLIQAKK